MDVLKKLFEQHFRSPVERIQPLQGELGGSGRKIIRLGSEKGNAIGVLYGVREENAAFLEFSRHFRRHGLPVPEIYGEDLDQGAYLEEDLGDLTLFEFLTKNRSGTEIAPARDRSVSQSGLHSAAISGGSGARLELCGVLSMRQLRSPIDRVGSELFQILFS